MSGTGKIADLVAKLAALSSAEFKQKVGVKIADACHAECIKGFNAKVDPYGAPWAPRKKPPDWAVHAFGLTNADVNHPLLDKNGKMIDSLKSKYVGGRVVMRMLDRFKFHQYGTVKMVARKMFPTGSSLGSWEQPIEKAAISAILEVLK